MTFVDTVVTSKFVQDRHHLERQIVSLKMFTILFRTALVPDLSLIFGTGVYSSSSSSLYLRE